MKLMKNPIPDAYPLTGLLEIIIKPIQLQTGIEAWGQALNFQKTSKVKIIKRTCDSGDKILKERSGLKVHVHSMNMVMMMNKLELIWAKLSPSLSQILN